MVAPMLPSFKPRRQGGGTAPLDERAVFTAVVHVLTSGCAWRHLPPTFVRMPIRRTRRRRSPANWRTDELTLRRFRPGLQRIRRKMGRAPGAVATVIDSQSVKAADTVGKDSRGYDAGKKINGRKRHLVVDTKGLPPFVMVTPADMTDRNAAKEVPFRLRLMHPEITIVWADSAYAGQLVTTGESFGQLW
ncbi:transposase [Streptomyces aurantiacus]|nr:transposase [Streptomyces aurantiacus]